MTPTQAQIEAAAKEIRIMLATVGNPTPENLAYAALTAAAEVGGGIGSFPEDDPRPGAFHAAAEVGEPKPTLTQIARTAEVITRAKVETIEHCAQIAEGFSQRTQSTAWEWAAKEIAAAIRALKDQP